MRLHPIKDHDSIQSKGAQKNVKIMSPTSFESEEFSETEDSEEYDPNKVNVPVSTILMSFDMINDP